MPIVELLVAVLLSVAAGALTCLGRTLQRDIEIVVFFLVGTALFAHRFESESGCSVLYLAPLSLGVSAVLLLLTVWVVTAYQKEGRL